MKRQLQLFLCAAGLLAVDLVAAPVVFRVPDKAAPGDVTLLYGGGLAKAEKVLVTALGEAGAEVSAPALQPCENSVKFVLPALLKPGVFSVQVEAGGERSPARLINQPEVWFLQPTTLQPGLDENQAPAGAEVQVIGKNFAVRGDAAPKPKLELRLKAGGPATALALLKAEPYSLIARLPGELAPGIYELRIHNGHGGEAAWSLPFTIEIRKPDAWPDQVFNVRDFGAKGDDVADDTPAVREALAAAGKNGGGIVLFPWGTYRLKEWLFIPERTTLRGAGREATLLKWPVDEPQKPEEFTKAALYAAARYAIEDLTIVVRKVDVALLDLSVELNNGRTIPPELASKLRPWGQSRDKFLRRVRFQHWLLIGHPERSTVLAKKYSEAAVLNFQANELRNFELSDCEFQGAGQQFVNITNGRIVRSGFSNQLGPCWTCLGGGAINLVCEGNDLRCSSSFGWGWLGMQRIYSAHNKNWNFERGEREAMTCDISALPTARPASQHWGACAEAGERDGKSFLRFAGVNWTPDCFAGGAAMIRSANQTCQITGNTIDTVFLDKPLPKTFDRTLAIEIAPRHWRAQGGTTAWLGRLRDSQATEFTAETARWIPQEFVGMTALVLDGKGAGQYRVITANTADHVTLDRAWDVTPDATSSIGIWSLMRHMIVYACEAEDTSAFAQLYGSFYDYIVDGCKLERAQGIWGQMGWFVQFRDNQVSFGNSYHPGIGMRGQNPEKCAPFGYTGLDGSRLRITKAQAFQYPDKKLPVFADEVLPAPPPSTLGLVLRGNTLRYNQRLVIQPWSSERPPGPRPPSRIRDVIIEGNLIEHGAAGIQIGPDVAAAIIGHNDFNDVAQPILEAVPNTAKRIEP